MTFRTSDDILKSYQQSVERSDPSADSAKGPLYALVGKPMSETLSPTEEKADELEQVYSAQFAETASQDQAQAFLTNWGEAPGQGEPSQVPVFFMKFSRPLPDEIIPIPVGAVVGNFDQTLQFVTIESGVIRGDVADSYFNAQRRSFEVSVLCQAVANGPDYNLPQGRINQRITPLPGIDAIENREKSDGGVEAESIPNQIGRTQHKFEGLAINTAAGAFSRIKSFSPTIILDVKTVLSTNRQLFRRVTFKPGMDHYMLASSIKTVNETYQAVGGETEIPLKSVPVQSINSVTLNGVTISNFSLVSDTSPETGLSSRAQDKLLLATPLLNSDVLIISVSYNRICQDVQTKVLSDTTLFQTDELARLFRPVPIIVEYQGKTLSSYDPNEVTKNVEAKLQGILEPGKWQEDFFPNVVRDQIKSSVPGLSSLVVKRFQRSTQAVSDIETVSFNDSEIADYNPAYVTISLKNS